MITALVGGVIIALAGLFILLAAHQILPHGINVISQWYTGSQALSIAMIVVGVLAMGYGLYQVYQLHKAKEKGSDMIDQVPQNITHLNLSLGNHLNDWNQASYAVDLAISKLNTFENLEYISLDLSGIAYYTERVHAHTEQMLRTVYQYAEVNFGTQGKRDIINVSGLLYPNNAEAANRAVDGLIKYVKDKPIPVIDIQFKDHVVTISKVPSQEGERLKITRIKGDIRNEERSYS